MELPVKVAQTVTAHFDEAALLPPREPGDRPYAGELAVSVDNRSGLVTLYAGPDAITIYSYAWRDLAAFLRATVGVRP